MASTPPQSRRRQPLPAALLLAALLAAAAPSLLLPVSAQAALPDKGSCVSTAASQQNNLNVLAPCVGGPTSSCCSTVNGFAGPGAPLAYCLCYPDLLEQLLETVESNSLAKRFGVDRNLVSSVLNSCNIPNANKAGSCPATPGGPGVSVTAPGTTVGVAPGGATSVTAPGTNVNAGPGGTSVTAPFTNVNVGGASKPGPATAPAAAAGPAPPQPASGGRPPFGSRIVKALQMYCDTHPWHPACSK
ncbi:hypothetical protein HXX76_001269 [Chlamydomonas incerta]|uniref:Bifunctional inhibitor/plant lipid transfer protein/seed storage helical domain-containing protein n=1 Tax=Chlamydomonas incerta TaxID=51695 RepID=A0A835WBY4_CHLIN|nr:hypothetical protein HXX76_001269 [Chlamydomonas incerta]|eukprot:KAG2444522.1 hypothetical protein HXX76_001269 [Chlamydomonas incerta]